ncbi:autophagy protein 12-like [Coccinella septempunctata]|uniref:autophagy protein 12-like n=1 Tax=Coccinella septempunctata TaxID=41139 RepID=UPI001D07B25A|nr:autophagy protein 12-like [Coccinella septempunctata]
MSSNPDEQEAQGCLQALSLNDDNPEEKTKIHKIDIYLKPIANAPIMKKQKWCVDSSKQISWILWFVAKYIKLEPQEKLFLYVNQTFAPAPDQNLKNLYDCYATEGKLVLHYCKTQAWG